MMTDASLMTCQNCCYTLEAEGESEIVGIPYFDNRSQTSVNQINRFFSKLFIYTFKFWPGRTSTALHNIKKEQIRIQINKQGIFGKLRRHGYSFDSEQLL